MTDRLPANVDIERLVLGSILLNEETFDSVVAGLSLDVFSLEKHRRIFKRIAEMHARGEEVDRITLSEELIRRGELDSVDGLTYLVSLNDGLPELPKIDSYVGILQDKAALRRILHDCDLLVKRVVNGDNLEDVAKAAEGILAGITARGPKQYRVVDIPNVSDCGGVEMEYIRNPELPKGAVIALTGNSGSGKSTLATAWARDASVPVLILDRENPVSVITDRFLRLGMVESPSIRVWGGWLPEEAPLPSAPTVTQWVKSCTPRPLVVVDSLVAFHGGNENDAGETRAFMHTCRRLADLGATVLIIHHDGKAETARDFRGSSDFKAAIDLGFHVSNTGDTGRLDKLLLRPFKQRIHVGGEIRYEYAAGQLVRAKTREAIAGDQLMALLRKNPGVTARKYDELALAAGLGRNRARAFLRDGLQSGSIRLETGGNNLKRHFPANEALAD